MLLIPQNHFFPNSDALGVMHLMLVMLLKRRFSSKHSVPHILFLIIKSIKFHLFSFLSSFAPTFLNTCYFYSSLPYFLFSVSLHLPHKNITFSISTPHICCTQREPPNRLGLSNFLRNVCNVYYIYLNIYKRRVIQRRKGKRLVF